VPSLVADRRVDLTSEPEAADVILRAEELVEESATFAAAKSSPEVGP
jgi:hypothetical protein